jgi:hypothetical protein
MKKNTIAPFYSGLLAAKKMRLTIKLIAEDKMIDVMYDLSILDAIKYQNPASLETYKINPSQYIYKSIKLTAHNLHKAISIMLLTIRTTKKCMMRLSNESMQKK